MVLSLVILGVVISLFLSCPTGSVEEFNFRFRIRNGMTLNDVEAVLGPAKEIDRKHLPVEKDKGQVVQGERFFHWEYEPEGIEIYLGFRDGKVCDKWFWAPSL
jgi:hypothetical protein